MDAPLPFTPLQVIVEKNVGQAGAESVRVRVSRGGGERSFIEQGSVDPIARALCDPRARAWA